MNQDNKLPGSESDPMVSAEYRATATERTPPALDAAVLKQAETAARNSGLRGFTAFWFRPLAFVATLALSLALLLELTGPMNRQFVDGPDPESARQEAESSLDRREAESTVADPIPSAIGITGPDRRSEDTPAGADNLVEAPAQLVIPNNVTGRMQQPELAPSAANAPVADVDASADFAEMIEASSKQMHEQNSVTETAIQGLQQTRADNKEQVGEAAAVRASAFMLEEAARPCTEEQMAVPMTWWQCISDLEEAGRHDEAKVELELFNKAHPDFEAPETLPAQ